jgi:alkylation response protein AidB-like acyl-CoA dehydrogenase
MALHTEESQEQTFIETALKLGGKSDDEARKTGAIDRADEQVEDMFALKYQTTGSPIHRAVWDAELPIDLFCPEKSVTPADSQKVMDASLAAVKAARANGTLMDDRRKISDGTLEALGKTGYWGLLVDKEYGGTGTPFQSFARFLTQMSTADATIAGMASVHGCIGAIDPLRTFGSPEQKKEYLPQLGSGKRLSAFALTEPCAGSDLTALRTKAELDGDDYVVNGEKLFITNAVPGRTVGLVCLINNKPAVLVADLPEQENDQFKLVTYGLYALKHTNNNGLLFKNFRVPKKNLLQAGRGDGLTIAYHGLNRGRVALCATAAGSMRMMLAGILPWAHYRQTYGAGIDTRELVRRRIGRLAAMIVGCDALTDWCGWLLDQGYRGEMECIIAKIVGSEFQKEACIEIMMKTHGGRAFLHGHPFGDNVHEFLAPCIYEGEGEMLGMAFFKSLLKEHGKKFFEPIGKVLHANGIKQPNMLNPMHVLKLRKAVTPYLGWRMSQVFGGWKRAQLPALPADLAEHAQYAADGLQKSRLWIDALMQRHQLHLADRQCAMAALSLKIQSLVLMLTTSLWAARQQDETVKQAAIVLCQDLKRGLTGKSPTTAEYRAVTKLGESIAAGNFKQIAGIDAGEILMPYKN